MSRQSYDVRGWVKMKKCKFSVNIYFRGLKLFVDCEVINWIYLHFTFYFRNTWWLLIRILEIFHLVYLIFWIMIFPWYWSMMKILKFILKVQLD